MSARGKVVFLFLLVFAFSLMIRVLFIRSVVDRDWPYSVFFYGDSQHYHLYAVSLIEGKLYDQGIPFHPPFYAWFLSGLYRVLGVPAESGFPYKFWMAVINAFTVAITWCWWRKTLGSIWSWIATALLCFHFGWLLFSATYANEVLYCLILSMIAALLWIRAPAFSFRDAAALGVCMGIGSLTRGENSSLWPFLLIYLWMQRDREAAWSLHLRKWLLAVGISLVLLIPTTVRNWRILNEYNQKTSSLQPLQRFVPVTSYGAVNFALANSETADGGFSPDLINRFGGGGGINLEDPEHRRLYVEGYSIGLRWLASNPVSALKLMMLKINRWLDGFRLGFGVSDFPSGLSGNRPPVDLFVPENNFWKWPRAILLGLGVFFSIRKEHRAYSICSLILLHRIILTMLFFGYARGLVVLLPIVIPLLLLPLMILASKWPVVRKAVVAVTIVAVVLLTLQALEIAAGEPRNFRASGSSDNRGKIIQDDWVQIWPAPD